VGNKPNIMQEEVKRGRGRPRKLESEKKKTFTVALLPHVHEWLLAQPGGMSNWIEQQAMKAMKRSTK
jgi:hypothetical protein